MKRILAWAGILAIAAVFLALLYFTATGAPANVLLGLLFILLVVPTILYGYLLFLKARRKMDKENEEK